MVGKKKTLRTLHLICYQQKTLEPVELIILLILKF